MKRPPIPFAYYFRRIFNPDSINRETRDFLKQHVSGYLSAAPVIIEAGAHKGWDTMEMAKVWPQGSIYAFEPVPELFRHLQKNTRRFPNVRCFPLALGERSGKSEMYVSGGASDGSSSLLKPKHHLTEEPGTVFERMVPVPVVTIDEWAEQHGVIHCDFLWLDMQGMELAALKAAPRLFATVKALYIEVSLTELYAGCPLYPEVRSFLEAGGFKVTQEQFGSASWGTVLFVRA